MDAREKELLPVGVAGVIGVCFCLYALVFPAIAVLKLTDGVHASDPVFDTIAWAFVVAVTAAIAAELVVCAAAIRTAAIGAWPGRRFLLGRPAAGIGAAALAFTGAPAVVL